MRTDTPYLKVKEAADYLGCHTNTVYSLLQRREIAFTRVGSSYRVSQQALRDYLARNHSRSVTPRTLAGRR